MMGVYWLNRKNIEHSTLKMKNGFLAGIVGNAESVKGNVVRQDHGHSNRKWHLEPPDCEF